STTANLYASWKGMRKWIYCRADRKAFLALLCLLFIGSVPLYSTDVRDFGAKGDGVADDTEAIYAAMRAAEDGELFFSKGNYRITRRIDIELDQYGPLVVSGVAGGSTILMEGSGAAFVVRGTHEGSALPESVKESVWKREKF